MISTPVLSISYEKDLIIDVFSMIVLLLLFWRGMRHSSLTSKKKQYKYLTSAFGLLAISFLFKILSHFMIYYSHTEVHSIGIITLTYNTIRSSKALVFWGLLFYRVFSLLAYYFLYSVYTKQQPRSSIILIIYFLFLAAYISNTQYFMYHLTNLIMLVLITENLFKRYKDNKYSSTLLLSYSFLIITLSQGLFIFTTANVLFYIIAEVVQLIGYVLLLVTYIRVVRRGKKA